MKIAVLVKHVPDTYGERRLDTTTGLIDRLDDDQVADEINERALEVALSHRDADKSTEVIVISMGPTGAKDALRKCLSMGADSAIHILDDELQGSDAATTAEVLSAALAQQGVDLILAGNESTDGRGGIVPALIAEFLGVALLSSLGSVAVTSSEVSGSRETEFESLRVHTALPAVVSITESSADARFPNFKGIMTAKRKPLTVLTLSQLGIGVEGSVSKSILVSTLERAARGSGTKVIDDGTASAQLVDYLASERLI
ncbi:MAG: electron transfer flavoprotein subunit beta [Subtercola sp.]|nr:electron transfer flavoprotein subunit beta [Subtercola sp.]